MTGKTLRSAALNLLVALIEVYGLIVSGMLLLRALVGESVGLVGLFTSFLHVLILPSLILLPLIIALRFRWTAMLLVAPVILTFVTYAPYFVPRAANVSAATTQVQLLSFNINGRNRRIDDVLKVIEQSKADMVAIQELSPWMAEAFAMQLQDVYPHQALHPRDDLSGQGILSRYPITQDEYWQINLGHQRVQIDYPGTTITLFNTHPIHPLRGTRYDGDSRAEEVTDILNRAAGESGRLLIIGDFNMTEFTEDYARIVRRYTDTYREVGWGLGFTFPHFGNAFGLVFMPPLARIDYVFHSRDFQAIEAHVGMDAAGSDHFPLFASLALGTED